MASQPEVCDDNDEQYDGELAEPAVAPEAGENEKRGERAVRLGPLLCFGGALVGISALLYPFVAPGLRRSSVPYIPATDSQLRDAFGLTKAALKTCRPHKRLPRVVDLGSGDGRVVIRATKELNVLGDGFELNRWLVLYSKLRARFLGVSHKTHFQVADMWKVDLSNYDVVYLFLGSDMMTDIERKLDAELQRSSSVITTRFPLPSWKPSQKLGLATLYMAKDQERRRQQT
mmetsp:Transcript_2795/g.8496  ORF Transcript_2795/g.8496 Transcript_2795/m.8496 type:complete len:231 (+) Transcript_2795:93-785(+)